MEIYFVGKIHPSQMNLEIPTSVTKVLNICTLKILYRTQYTGQRLIQMALCTQTYAPIEKTTLLQNYIYAMWSCTLVQQCSCPAGF